MGESARRKAAGYVPKDGDIFPTPPLIYHWTSSLKIHQMTQDGVINVEQPHPYLVTTEDGATMLLPGHARNYSDYPGLVWFTTEDVPPRTMAWSITAEAMGATRVAIAFDPVEIGAVRWADYPGRDTPTGRKMDALARKRGDDPRHWWVMETPASMAQCRAVIEAPKK